MLRILLVGHGRMGQLVGQLAGEYDCQVAGIIDAEAKPRGFFGAERLAVLAALALVATAVLP